MLYIAAVEDTMKQILTNWAKDIIEGGQSKNGGIMVYSIIHCRIRKSNANQSKDNRATHYVQRGWLRKGPLLISKVQYSEVLQIHRISSFVNEVQDVF